MPQSPTRKLAAIISADIAGYSRLMAEDETRTLGELRKFRGEVFEPNVEEHRGRIVKNMGDGWLVEFNSVLDAASCATAIQERLRDGGPIAIRLGIHVGEIVHENEDIFGDGVNIAARLQQLAAPGAVLISGDAQKFIDGKMEIAFENLGTRKLKNISKAIEVFGWSPVMANGRSLISPQHEKKPASGIPVILVDELRVAGSSDEAAILAEDIRFELLLVLSRRAGIKVISERKSEIRPRYILGGRCRVSGGIARLDISMLAGESGETLWTKRFEGSPDKPDDLVAKVAQYVSGSVRTQTSAYDGAELANLPDEELSFDELLSKAAYHALRWDKENVEIARQSLQTALTYSPESPSALAMLAALSVNLVFIGYENVGDVEIGEVMEIANKAVSRGPNIDFVFMTRSNCRLWLLRDYQGAKSDVERALKINPDYQELLMVLGTIEVFSGEPQKGADRLVNLMDFMSGSPLLPIFFFSIGYGYLLAGDCDKALEYAMEGYERAPSMPACCLAFAVAAADKPDIVHSPNFKNMIKRMGLRVSMIANLPLSREGDTAFLGARLRTAGVPE